MPFRASTIPAFVAAALLLTGCGAEGDAPADETPTPESAVAPDEPEPTEAAPPRPTSGGTVLAVGSLYVEVLVRGDGAIEVVTLSEDFPSPAQVLLTLTITGEDGAPHPVVLTWDPARGRFRGWMRAALPIPGAIELKLVDGDQTRQGRSSTVVVSAPPTDQDLRQPHGASRPRSSSRATSRPGTPEPPGARTAGEAPRDTSPPRDDAPPPTIQTSHGREVAAPPPIQTSHGREVAAPRALVDRAPLAIRPDRTAPVLESARPGRANLVDRRGRAAAPAPRTRPVQREGATVRLRE